MSDAPQTPSDIAAEAARVAAKVSVDASLVAEKLIAKAAEVAEEEKYSHESKDKEMMTESLVDALNKVFGEKQEQQQFINLSRVPMICIQIQEIHKNLEAITLTMAELQASRKLFNGILIFLSVTIAGALATAFFSVIIRQ